MLHGLGNRKTDEKERKEKEKKGKGKTEGAEDTAEYVPFTTFFFYKSKRVKKSIEKSF